MSSIHLADLPPELLLQAVSYLPISSLLSLSATNKAFRNLTLVGLTTLRLTSFPKKLHTTLCRLEDDSSTYKADQTVHLTLPLTTERILPLNLRHTSPSPPRTKYACRSRSNSPPDAKSGRNAVFEELNDLLLQTLRSSSLQLCHLRILSLHSWSPTASLLSFLATMPQFTHLTHLTLNFHQPTHRHPYLPSQFWVHPDRPSPIWNSIVGLGSGYSATLRLRNLESLTLHRCGITTAQLTSWITHNPNLKSLHLHLVRGVSVEFLRFLAACDPQIQSLELIDCDNLHLPVISTEAASACNEPRRTNEVSSDAGFESVTRLARLGGLRRLVIRRCDGVTRDPRTVRRLRLLNRKMWNFEEFIVGEMEEQEDVSKLAAEEGMTANRGSATGTGIIEPDVEDDRGR